MVLALHAWCSSDRAVPDGESCADSIQHIPIPLLTLPSRESHRIQPMQEIEETTGNKCKNQHIIYMDVRKCGSIESSESNFAPMKKDEC